MPRCTPGWIGLFLFACFARPALAQEAPAAVPDTLSLPSLFPGLAPQMIGQDQWEFLLFNPLTTFKLDNQVDSSVFRGTQFTHILQVNYGLLRSRRLNVGVELQYGHARSDSEENSSPFRVLGNQRETGRSFHSFSAMGLRLRAMPIGTLPELTVQSALLFPVGKDSLHRAALGRQRIEWQLQASFYQRLRPWLTAFLDLNYSARFSNSENRQTDHIPGFNLFLTGEVIRNRLYVYPGIGYSVLLRSRFMAAPGRVDINWLYTLGVQYCFSGRLALALQWSRLFDQITARQVQKIQPRSFNSVSLSARWLLGS